MRDLTPLCKLAIKYSTDKGGRHNTYNHEPCHGSHEYTPLYFDLFPKPELVKSVLEIGVNRGCSLRMWQEFFPNAMITGLDIDSNYSIKDQRIQCFQADQGDSHSLQNALQKAQAHPFDLIIDDGSHDMNHQVTSLNTLVEFLSPSGIYVIEDIARNEDWHAYVLRHVPLGFHGVLIYPEQGTGSMGLDTLCFVRRE